MENSLAKELKFTKEFLDEKELQYNHPRFIEKDPISIPHLFGNEEDIEIAGFLTATISWGQRITILRNARKLMEWMDRSPHQFILHFQPSDLNPFKHFVHRTFNGEDCCYFLKALQHIYRYHGGLKEVFEQSYGRNNSIFEALSEFRELFFSQASPGRTAKHVANVKRGASGKRLNMFLRWMVRNDNAGVDFGLWKNINQRDLFIPLDLHSGNVARKLGILQRKQNDWKAVEELTSVLRQMDADDPVKYDFALFGMGMYESYQ